MEQFGLKIFIDLISKMRDVNINDVGSGVEMVIPHVCRNHRSGDDLTRTSHEVFKKRVFLGGELNLYPVAVNAMSVDPSIEMRLSSYK